MTQVSLIFLLLLIFQVKHFLCDFPLQGRYMLGKFKTGTDWILPLGSHAGVHALFTYAISFYFLGLGAWAPAFFDCMVHFTVDRVKASPNLLGRYKHTEQAFWNILGLDQFCHHLTHYVIIWWLIKS